jgi:hypothetical protein
VRGKSSLLLAPRCAALPPSVVVHVGDLVATAAPVYARPQVLGSTLLGPCFFSGTGFFCGPDAEA